MTKIHSKFCKNIKIKIKKKKKENITWKNNKKNENIKIKPTVYPYQCNFSIIFFCLSFNYFNFYIFNFNFCCLSFFNETKFNLN